MRWNQVRVSQIESLFYAFSFEKQINTSTVGLNCAHVFLLPAIRSVVIPGEDPESRVRFDTLDSPLPAFAGMT